MCVSVVDNNTYEVVVFFYSRCSDGGAQRMHAARVSLLQSGVH
jgi:hypothetical protein